MVFASASPPSYVRRINGSAIENSPVEQAG
jgi:hypothetical protein